MKVYNTKFNRIFCTTIINKYMTVKIVLIEELFNQINNRDSDKF